MIHTKKKPEIMLEIEKEARSSVDVSINHCTLTLPILLFNKSIL